jgi:hypothetical protein
MKAVEVIMEHGVPEDRIIFINLVGVAFLTLFYFKMSHVGESADLCTRGLEKVRCALPVA